jgi:hypothetical protein
VKRIEGHKSIENTIHICKERQKTSQENLKKNSWTLSFQSSEENIAAILNAGC